jgi:hypothetical protein
MGLDRKSATQLICPSGKSIELSVVPLPDVGAASAGPVDNTGRQANMNLRKTHRSNIR